MHDCADFEHRLSELIELDSGRSTESQAAIDRDLAAARGCPRCQRLLKGYRLTVHLLRALPSASVPADFAARTAARAFDPPAKDGRRARQSDGDRARGRFGSATVLRLGSAAAVLVAAALGAWFSGRSPERGGRDGDWMPSEAPSVAASEESASSDRDFVALEDGVGRAPAVSASSSTSSSPPSPVERARSPDPSPAGDPAELIHVERVYEGGALAALVCHVPLWMDDPERAEEVRDLVAGWRESREASLAVHEPSVERKAKSENPERQRPLLRQESARRRAAAPRSEDKSSAEIRRRATSAPIQAPTASANDEEFAEDRIRESLSESAARPQDGFDARVEEIELRLETAAVERFLHQLESLIATPRVFATDGARKSGALESPVDGAVVAALDEEPAAEAKELAADGLSRVRSSITGPSLDRSDRLADGASPALDSASTRSSRQATDGSGAAGEAATPVDESEAAIPSETESVRVIIRLVPVGG